MQHHGPHPFYSMRYATFWVKVPAYASTHTCDLFLCVVSDCCKLARVLFALTWSLVSNRCGGLPLYIVETGGTHLSMKNPARARHCPCTCCDTTRTRRWGGKSRKSAGHPLLGESKHTFPSVILATKQNHCSSATSTSAALACTCFNAGRI